MPSSAEARCDFGHRAKAVVPAGISQRASARTRCPAPAASCIRVSQAARSRALTAGILHAQVEHALRRTLQQHEGVPGVIVMQGGHEAVFGLERNFVDPWRCRSHLQRVQAGLEGEGQQCTFGRSRQRVASHLSRRA
jgi:hypothetical protein